LLAFGASCLLVVHVQAEGEVSSLPRIVEQDGRHALLVDGEPYLILGAQANNSSAWPAMLPKVWPAMEAMHVNTVELPIYWEQFEPEPGRFDTSVVDTILREAREHDFRLIMLWFATWKNGSNHYMPPWIKLDAERYPNMIGRDGKAVDSPSPHAAATLEADKKAFVAFMRHLKEADPQQTVIMVQVENEPGTWNAVRDFSPAAQKVFDGPVPPEVLSATQKTASPDANWSTVFGKDADEFFHVWHVARFIGQVAEAGKAEYPLPLYVNGSVREPIKPAWPPDYQVGGPNDNVFELWKAAAPAIDFVAPDIYARDTASYLKLLDFYNRPDNALFVPETIGQGNFPRFFYAALGRGAIGYAPFGLDFTRRLATRTGAPLTREEFVGPTATNYRIFRPMARKIARLNFEGKLQTAVQGEKEPRPEQLAAAPASQGLAGPPDRVLHFDGWDAAVAFGTFGRNGVRPKPIPIEPGGRALVAQLGENQFLVTGLAARVVFYPTGKSSGRVWQYLAVEEGEYEDSDFQPQRILNGDQTDWGLIFAETPSVLRVSLYVR
jgi:hypothetical protein